jgi:Tfp pilus assembly protein PilF
VAHNNLGALYFNIGKKEEAFKELKEALRERPIYARPHYNFGLYYINVGEYDKAIEHLEKAIQIEPEFLPGHKLLIMAYEKKGLKEKIKEANKKYLRYAESSKIYLPGE